MRWQVQEMEGEVVAGNTLDRVLFQRAMNFVGSGKRKIILLKWMRWWMEIAESNPP